MWGAWGQQLSPRFNLTHPTCRGWELIWIDIRLVFLDIFVVGWEELGEVGRIEDGGGRGREQGEYCGQVGEVLAQDVFEGVAGGG